MEHAVSTPRPTDRFARRRWTALIGVLAAVALLATVGSVVPVPILDVFAASLSPFFMWTFVFAVLVVVLSVFVVRRKPTPTRIVVAAVAVLCVVLTVIMGSRIIGFAAAQGVPISVGQAVFGSHLDAAPNRTLQYDQHDGDALSLSVWEPEHRTGDAPVIVMTHGGGFAFGSVTEAATPAHARWFTDQGYLVIGANYSLASETKQTWDVTEPQIGCALAWAGEHASEYGGDVTRLAMFGDSAGGNLVINAAAKAASGDLTSSCGGTIPKVDAVSGLYPAVGVVESYENEHPLGAFGRMLSAWYMGGSPSEFPERYASVESLNAVTEATPPTLLTYGASDHLVPPVGAEHFAQRAQELGVDVEQIAVPYGEHGFDAANTGSIPSQIWRESTLEWFRGHGAAV